MSKLVCPCYECEASLICVVRGGGLPQYGQFRQCDCGQAMLVFRGSAFVAWKLIPKTCPTVATYPYCVQPVHPCPKCARKSVPKEGTR